MMFTSIALSSRHAHVNACIRSQITFVGGQEVAFEEIVLLYTKGRGDEEGEDGCLQMQAYTKIPIPDLKVGLGTGK